MPVEWTPHRFSGGALALDVANTVVLRGDAARSFDRFDDPAEIARFAHAAAIHRAEELGGCALHVAEPARIASKVIALREATDRLFRQRAASGQLRAGDLPPFLARCAAMLEGSDMRVAGTANPFGDLRSSIPFEAALALSALSLLESARMQRIRICSNCRWLFLDESRNRSRIWCDMAVCGNRRKAQRHYRRRKPIGEEQHA